MKRLWTAAAVCLLMTGCLKTRAELDAERGDFEQERQTQSQQRAQQQPAKSADKPVYKEKAPPAAYRFEEYDEQIRQLSGRVDALENSLTQVGAARAADREGMNKNTLIVQDKFTAYEEALKKLDAQVQQLAEEVNKLKTAPPPAPAPTAAETGAGGPAAAGKKTPYDLGEEQFAAHKWKDAILHYQKYRDTNPKGKLYGESTYKIGVCFQELGMKEEARSFFEEVAAKFPKSKEAKKAALRLKSLK